MKASGQFLVLKYDNIFCICYSGWRFKPFVNIFQWFRLSLFGPILYFIFLQPTISTFSSFAILKPKFDSNYLKLFSSVNVVNNNQCDQ